MKALLLRWLVITSSSRAPQADHIDRLDAGEAAQKEEPACRRCEVTFHTCQLSRVLNGSWWRMGSGHLQQHHTQCNWVSGRLL